MQIFYITSAVLALAPLGSAQSSAPVDTLVHQGRGGTDGSIVNHVGFKVRDMKDMTTTAENHQVHFFTPDIDAMQKWYAANFGAAPQAFGKVKLDTPYRKVPQMGLAVAFLTDRSAAAPSAQSQKPAQQ